MKGLIQRVSEASVSIDEHVVGKIDQGLLLFLGVERNDTDAELEKLLHKVIHYRIFPDAAGRMNLNVQEAGGGILVVSQFTLAADTRKGLRPGFSSAAEPKLAELLYLSFVDKLRTSQIETAAGVFGADMQVSLINDGPVTFLLES